MSLGLEHGKNRLSTYSDEWPRYFESESKKILQVCAAQVLSLKHVGSTSIPGLVAKPIIDIAAGVTSLDVAELMIDGMQSIGYDFPGDVGIHGDRIFGRDPNVRRFLVHVVVLDSPQWRQYVQFRDALIADAQLVAEYAQLKIDLVEKYPEGRPIYTTLKTEFIQKVIAAKE